MPEHLRALIVILFLATVVFAFAKAPACTLAIAVKDFTRRRNLWFAITLVAFLAHNFWVYIIAAAFLLHIALLRESNKLAMYFFLLFAVPAIEAKITGLGAINHFFTIHYYRLLSLTVLLPAFLFLRKQPDTEHFGRLFPDKLLAGYIVVGFLLQLMTDSFTNTLRQGLFYPFLDIILPYYVASRSLKHLQGFRDALMSFVVAAMVLCLIGAFEYARHWLLYSRLQDALGVPGHFGYYLEREESLRAAGSFGHPIPLGYVMAVATGFFLYLRKSVPNPTAWGLGLILLMVGLIAPVSRGPWVGAAAIFLLFIATGPSPALRLAKLGLLGVIIVPVLLVTPAGQSMIDHLPFVGTVEVKNITYRERLIENSIKVIARNPFFGAHDYLYAPEMQELKQGQGIIDIVNTYLGVALTYGLVGLSLFAGFFVTVAAGIFKGMRNLADRNNETHLLGQVLFSTLVGILIMIFTVSSITIVPVIYWSVAGLGVAYTRMLALAKAPIKAPEAAGSYRLPPAIIKIRT